MLKVNGYGFQEKNMREENMNEVYNIRHCIWCGKKGFKDSQAVIEHITADHTRAA